MTGKICSKLLAFCGVLLARAVRCTTSHHRRLPVTPAACRPCAAARLVRPEEAGEFGRQGPIETKVSSVEGDAEAGEGWREEYQAVTHDTREQPRAGAACSRAGDAPDRSEGRPEGAGHIPQA